MSSMRVDAVDRGDRKGVGKGFFVPSVSGNPLSLKDLVNPLLFSLNVMVPEGGLVRPKIP